MLADSGRVVPGRRVLAPGTVYALDTPGLIRFIDHVEPEGRGLYRGVAREPSDGKADERTLDAGLHVRLQGCILPVVRHGTSVLDVCILACRKGCRVGYGSCGVISEDHEREDDEGSANKGRPKRRTGRGKQSPALGALAGRRFG